MLRKALFVIVGLLFVGMFLMEVTTPKAWTDQQAANAVRQSLARFGDVREVHAGNGALLVTVTTNDVNVHLDMLRSVGAGFNREAYKVVTMNLLTTDLHGTTIDAADWYAWLDGEIGNAEFMRKWRIV